MNVATYLENKRRLNAGPQTARGSCLRCKQSLMTCFCAEIRQIDPLIQFVVLIHPMESRRRIATGRMAHLSLTDSLLLEGEDFTADSRVQRLIDDPANACFILYPGPGATDLGRLSVHERAEFLPSGRKPVIFVIDGTWRTARKMLRLSRSLAQLPRICFAPSRPSGFSSVRKQPSAECFSTIEAIHETIALLGPARGFNVASGSHNVLLEVFEAMVKRQIDFALKPPVGRRG